MIHRERGRWNGRCWWPRQRHRWPRWPGEDECEWRDEDETNERDLWQLFAELVEFLLQWGLLFLCSGHLRSNLTWKRTNPSSAYQESNKTVCCSEEHYPKWMRLPISVLRPVPITTPRHLPAAMLVPYETRDQSPALFLTDRLTENRMFFLSWFTARGSGIGSVCLITDTLSPVNNDWSIRRVVE